MKTFRYSIIAATLGTLVVSGFQPAQAQQHEMTFQVNGGLSTLTFKGTFGPVFGGGIGYSYYFFDSPLAVSTGISASYLRPGYRIDSLKSYDNSGLVDEFGDAYELHSTLRGYNETQTITMINIPVMIHYLFPPIGEAGRIYTGFGVKFGLPISARYKSSTFTVKNLGHYETPDFTGEAQGPRYLGYGEFSGLAATGDLELKPSISLAAEVGWRFPLSEKTALYAGLYIDYGINDVRKDKALPFVEVNTDNPEDFDTRSILVSGDQSGKAVVSHVSPVDFGLVVKFAFGSVNESGKKKSKKPAEVKPQLNDSIKAITDKLRKEQDTIRKTLDKHGEKLDEQSKRLDRIEELLKKFADQRTQQLRDTSVVTRIDGFELNGYSLNYKSRADMEHNVAVLKKYPNLRVIIEGYGDDLGTSAATLQVSRRRAEMVKLYLLDHGIAPERIIATIGRGNTKPIVPNINEAYRRINRRVEITVRQD